MSILEDLQAKKKNFSLKKKNCKNHYIGMYRTSNFFRRTWKFLLYYQLERNRHFSVVTREKMKFPQKT